MRNDHFWGFESNFSDTSHAEWALFLHVKTHAKRAAPKSRQTPPSVGHFRATEAHARNLPPPGAGGLGGWVVGGVAGWLAGLAGWLAGWLAGMGKVIGFD